MSQIAMLVACLVLIAGPAAAQSKAVIQKADDKWAEAFNKGDAAALAAMYTEDAYMLPPGTEMMKGRRAIAACAASTCRLLPPTRYAITGCARPRSGCGWGAIGWIMT